ncbi:hypothetical protein [Lactiplantibacillus herbarum]|uniref:hypothetical protein n=1 Tax=Lactiplantibacillus herbarum TaxID=1670446 RepID=UPI0009E1BDD8|nr:hypothetical protein [Lactiplantibacillus herbarum]
MTNFWQHLWHHSDSKVSPVEVEVDTTAATTQETWVTVPQYLEVDPRKHVVPSLVAASVTAVSEPDSQLVLKHLYVQNPEAQLVSMIASCCATSLGDGEYVVKSIRKREDPS